MAVVSSVLVTSILSQLSVSMTFVEYQSMNCFRMKSFTDLLMLKSMASLSPHWTSGCES